MLLPPAAYATPTAGLKRRPAMPSFPAHLFKLLFPKKKPDKAKMLVTIWEMYLGIASRNRPQTFRDS